MSEQNYRLPLCPECRSFNVYTQIGDVPGCSVFDGWAALKKAKPHRQEFQVRGFSVSRCKECGHKWDYRDWDSLILTLEAKPIPTWRTIWGLLA